jgi:NAD+ diphosphatase
VLRPPLSASPVDRDGATRGDAAALAQAWDTASVLVLGEDGKVAVDGTSLVLLPSGEAPEGERLYLGRHDGTTYFAVLADPPRRLGTQRRGLRELAAVLSDRDAGLLVHAVGLANWHAAHPRCSRCGGPTDVSQGGSLRVCPQDGSQHFPRSDPAVIVLVTDGADRCVLGRQPTWPPGRYSTLAGFVEPGESAESAVVREVEEECGVVVDDIVYRGSQPWPFPSSLMIGFRAVARADATPGVRDGELEDVRWFGRDEVEAMGLTRPPAPSIAQALIAEWLAER